MKIPFNFENKLREKGLSGEHNPDIMRDTVLFFLDIGCSLRAGNKHYDLHHDAKDKR